MPLDGTGFKFPVEVEPFKGGREGLAQLSAALRQEMPPDFEWDFSRVIRFSACGTAGCAMGLARRLWPQQYQTALHSFPGIPTTSFFASYAYGITAALVTPTMVADRIDHWLATGEIR